MSYYIAFEGGEGCGKSTQAARLAERLDATLTREPGATEFGARLREILLNGADLNFGARSEALLMAADRAQHVDVVVKPSLERGAPVISDRSAFSSIAYQGAGRQLGVDVVRELNDWAIAGRWPDVVVLLKVDGDTAWSRLGRDRDRFESEPTEFHNRVRDAFDELAKSNPDSWLVVDGIGPVDDVAERVWTAVSTHLNIE